MRVMSLLSRFLVMAESFFKYSVRERERERENELMVRTEEENLDSKTDRTERRTHKRTLSVISIK